MQVKSKKMIIKIPEAPFPGTISSDIDTKNGPTPEIWEKWLAFARSDFVLMHIWAGMEYVRVMRIVFDHEKNDHDVYERGGLVW